MKPNEQDAGPYRIDFVLLIWGRIARTAEALHSVGAIATGPEGLRRIVDYTVAAGGETIDDADITRTLRVMAAQDGMHAGDWLRSRAAEAQMPRRKPPAALDLQIRLKGVQCKRLVAVCRPGADHDGEDVYRVTVTNVRGDIASVESTSFANALEGAIKMAGARADMPQEEP